MAGIARLLQGPRPYIGAVALLLLAPILVVVSAPLHTPATEWAYVRTHILPSYLGETLRLIALAGGLAIVFGTSTAWLVSACDFPGRRFFRWALVLPLALPTYISAITFAALFGPTGLLSDRLRAAIGVDIDILGPDGLALVFALMLFPYVYLPARAAFSAGMSDVLEAAKLLGAGARRRAFRVAFPLARPAIAGGVLLVCMEVLNDYGAVQYYGVHTLTAGIFRSWGGLYDVGSALRLAGVLLLVVLALALGQRLLKRGGLRTAEGRALRRVRLSGWRAVGATLWCGLLVLFAFALPIGALLADTLATWNATAIAELVRPVVNTLYVGTWAAGITLVVAVAFAFAQRMGYGGLTRLASVGYVVPGAVIAIGVMGLAGPLAARSGWVLIGSLTLVIYAFSVRFLALAGQPLQAGLSQQPRMLDEAAHLLGASPVRTFLRVNLPLLRPSLLAAAAIVLIEVVKELPLTLILRPFNFETLSTRVFDMARIEQWREAAPPALLIVACGLVPVLLLERWMERR